MDNDKQPESTGKKPKATDPGQRHAPWKPGESGNPKGRPKGFISVTSAIKRMLKEIAPNDSKERLYGNLLAESLIVNAIKGNGPAIKEIMNRVDGVVKEMQEHSGAIKVIVEYGDTANTLPRPAPRTDQG